MIFVGFDATEPLNCKVSGSWSPSIGTRTEPVTITGMVDVCIRASTPVVVQGTRAISFDHSRFLCSSFSLILHSFLHPPSLSSACESMCARSTPILTMPPVYSVAIWERNLIVTTVAVSAWLVTITFYMRSPFSAHVINLPLGY